MTMLTRPTLTALEAQATANLLLSDHLPDRFTADQPCFDAPQGCWRVPVLLTYPGIGVLGTVGEIQVAAQAATVLTHTSWDTMLQTAHALYDAHCDALAPPVL